MKIAIAKGSYINDQEGLLTRIQFALSCEVILVTKAKYFAGLTEADAFMDFDFKGKFYSPPEKPLLINETIHTLGELDHPPLMTARFCSWKGFIERPLWEIATGSSENEWLINLMAAIGKQYEIVEDLPGLVAPRILSMIINEAFYALEDGVSSPDEIDLAMKLGTNYPEGPISWANKIGKSKIFELLQKLEKNDNRYKPHQLLKPEK